MTTQSSEYYLAPYLNAAKKFGAGFGSLLWASPRTQFMRFEAIRQMFDPTDLRVLDVGCGRADFLGYLLEAEAAPIEYIGIEAVPELAAAARFQTRSSRIAHIIEADFVAEPNRLFVGADVIVFSGSLNTVDDPEFFQTLRDAYEAAGSAVVFNFLDSTYLAGKDYLYWRKAHDVQTFARQLCKDVQLSDGYLQGDCTVCLGKPADRDDSDDSEASHA